MPASMIMAEVGLGLNVAWIRRAIPAIGPMPGRTSINVPAMAPTKQ